MTTKLPDLPDMGAVTVPEAERIAEKSTGAHFGASTTGYVNQSLGVLPGANAARREYEQSLTERVAAAVVRVERVEPLASDIFPEVTRPGAMSLGTAQTVVRRATHDWSLEAMTTTYVLAAVQTLPSNDNARVAWKAKLEFLLDAERELAENGGAAISDLDKGPVPVP